DPLGRVRRRGPEPGHRLEDGAHGTAHLELDRVQVGLAQRRPQLVPRPGAGDAGCRALGIDRAVRRAAGGPDLPHRYVPLRRRARRRRPDGPRGHRLQGLRGAALLPDEPRHGGDRGDGDDRARVHRAHRPRAPDGIRPGAEPPDRAADGRSSRLMTSTDVKGAESAGDPTANEAVGHAAGAAPVAAGSALEDVDTTAAPELEEENLSLPGQPASAAHAALNRGARKRSFEVSEHEVAKSDVEEWRFTPLRRFTALFQDEPTDDRAGDPAVDYQVEVPEGAAEPSTLAPGQAPRGTVLVPEAFPTAVASARTEQALHLVAAKNVAYDAPFRIEMTGRGADRRGNAHIVLEAQESSSATFVLNHTGAAQYAQNVEMIIGDNAQMTVIP